MKYKSHFFGNDLMDSDTKPCFWRTSLIQLLTLFADYLAQLRYSAISSKIDNTA